MVFSPGLSMRLLQSRKGLSCFAFEHSEEYQQTQLRFLSAVESMEPNNIVVRAWAHGTPSLTTVQHTASEHLPGSAHWGTGLPSWGEREHGGKDLPQGPYFQSAQ